MSLGSKRSLTTRFGPEPQLANELATKNYVDTTGAFWPLVVIKSADEVINSDDTLSNDSELLLAMDATSTYLGQVIILADSAATPDLKFTIVYSGTTIDAGKSDDINGNTASALGTTSTVISGAWPLWHYTKFFIKTNSAGTMNFQWAQNTSDAAATTMMAGATLMAKKVV